MTMSYSPGGNILSKNMDALTYQSGVGDVAVFYENTYAYNYSQPHAISQINGSGGGQDLHWDLNGNLTRHIRTEPDLDRRLCWDEENRLTAVRDQNHLSAYIYDAGGERVWKLTGQVQQMYVDGQGYVDVVDLNNKTLYASPYLVYNEQGYSKHYYAGAERVSSRIGGGMLQAPLDPLSSPLEHLSEQENWEAIANDLLTMLKRGITCTEFDVDRASMESLLFSIGHSATINDPEENWCIYHSDHLGSSSFLTDASGDPTQHLQYMPFGETFVEQRSITSYYTPYTFSAKERDPETGYSYFGARYYSSDISIWLSVDPMAHKYPSMSAYMYCAGNPVMLVDPDGNYIFKLFGSTRAQRQAAREYAENTNGQVHRLHRKSIYVEYHQALPGYISSSKSQLPITILCIVTFNEKGNANDSGKHLKTTNRPTPNPSFPMERSSTSYLKGPGMFGSSREGGRRKHAGSDLYAPVGTVINAMEDGIILRGPYDFYRGSSAIEIDHGEYIARYCEIDVQAGLFKGIAVKRGQEIGHVSNLQLSNSMLHLELYTGKEAGPLTNRNNMPYQRRNDLINPTNFLKSISHEN
jgi:RHS repeat-associated protein